MNTPTVRTDCDVLVVGAGPTGLTLAAQLLARGLHTRIIDKDPGTPRLSRAIGIVPRTLETLDMMGIADRFLDVGHRVRGVGVYSGSRRLIGIDMAHSGSGYRFQLHLPQQQTEALLRERVAELGGAVETATELLAFTDDGGAVTSTVRDPSGREREISAAFLVGCDGAHSRVRHLLDVPFLGQPYPWDWLLADAHVDWAGHPDEVHVFTRPDGFPLLCVPITADLWRLSLPVPGDRGGSPPTLQEIRALVDERGPGRMVVSDPVTLTCFRCQIRSTPTYRRGRVLLAGDAVHIHSPAGGQGMNTGMLDATNLAWKLALVVAGRTSETLLDSYGRERGPVAAQVLGFTQSMVRFGTAARSIRRTLRDASLPALRLPPVQRRLAGRMSQVTVGYPDGPLTRPGQVAGLPRAGQRMPDLEVATHDGPGTLYAALRAGRHVIVAFGRLADVVVDVGPYRDLVDVVSAVRGHRPAAALVRPDGYVAAVGMVGDLSALHGYLREFTSGRPPGRAVPADAAVGA
jgi:2-polyprenyl-6-methoxyphenol hydroxylase-like FAD-dependent oxidoreductase